MRVSEINIYPVKSLKGITVIEAEVEPRGLRSDRRWLIVDKDGKFLTQRGLPKMATIGVAVSGNGLDVRADGFLPLRVDPIEGERVTALVWNSTSEAVAYDIETNEWFSDVLGKKVTLLYMPDAAGRPVNPRFDRGGEMVSFADGYPLMLLGEASLAELNSRLERPLPMNRFRPNLVVSGSKAFAEDDWKTIRIGEAVFRSTKPCERCTITTVDQSRGEFDGKEPLRTLTTFRSAREVMPERLDALGVDPTAVLFGQNLIADTPGAVVRVGDRVDILQTGVFSEN